MSDAIISVEWPIALDAASKERVKKIAEEQGQPVYEVIRVLTEEKALDYFRGRPDDPGRLKV